MSQWGFYYNQDRCLGCKTCIVACKQWNEERRGDAKINDLDIEKYSVPEKSQEMGSAYIDKKTGETNYPEFRKYYMKEMWRRLEHTDTGTTSLDPKTNEFGSTFDRSYISISCNHCAKPACIEACPQGIISKDKETGAVIVDNDKCISCGSCKDACPWGAPQFYDDNLAEYAENDPKRPKMTKCNLCQDRISKGLKTACAAACWNRAIDAGPIEELKAKYPKSVDKIVGFDKADTGPNIIFKAKTTFRKV